MSPYMDPLGFSFQKVRCRQGCGWFISPGSAHVAVPHLTLKYLLGKSNVATSVVDGLESHSFVGV